MNPILTTIRWTGIAACFVVETLKWVAVVCCVLVFAASFVYFGFHLERASVNYSKGKSMETLGKLYSSVDWAAVVEKEYKLRLEVQEKLRIVCKKSKRKECV